MKYTMEQIREAFYKGGLQGRVIKFLWFPKKGRKPIKCRAKMQWIFSNPEDGNFITVIGVKIGRNYCGRTSLRFALKDIVLLADNGLERWSKQPM